MNIEKVTTWLEPNVQNLSNAEQRMERCRAVWNDKANDSPSADKPEQWRARPKEQQQLLKIRLGRRKCECVSDPRGPVLKTFAAIMRRVDEPT